jgi:endonuclease YncB( thermonuclease family)
MVIDGQAVAYRQFSQRYVGEENAARAARRGIWGTEFEMPWEWRRNN